MTADNEIESQNLTFQNLLLDLKKKEIQLNQQLSDRTQVLQIKDPIFQHIFGKLNEIEGFIKEIKNNVNIE